MKPARFLLLLIAMIAILALSGCGLKRAETPKANKPEKTTVRQNTDNSLPPLPSEALRNDTSIRITRLDLIKVDPSNREGVYLNNYINAIDRTTGSNITHHGIGSPKFGTIKSYPDDQYRYFPPANDCLDEVVIRLYGKNNKCKDVVMKIQVGHFESNDQKDILKSTNVRPKKQITPNIAPVTVRETKLSITHPRSGQTVYKRVCRVDGFATGISDGTVLTFYVQSQSGDIWEQEQLSTVRTGRFYSLVYLGDAYGHGIGEKFSVWTKSPEGPKSNVVTIFRRA